VIFFQEPDIETSPLDFACVPF